MVENAMESKENKKIGNCFYCGKEIFENMDYLFGSGLFCSNECAIDYFENTKENEEIRKIGNCFNCGKEIYTNMSYIYGLKDLFCSAKCDMEYYKKKYEKLR